MPYCLVLTLYHHNKLPWQFNNQQSFIFFFQIIRMLTEKCKTQEQMIAEFEMREQEYQELESENDLLRQQVESSR